MKLRREVLYPTLWTRLNSNTHLLLSVRLELFNLVSLMCEWENKFLLMILHLTNGYYTHTEENDEMFPRRRVIHKNKQSTTKNPPHFRTGPKTELMMPSGRLSSSPMLACFKYLQHFIHLDYIRNSRKLNTHIKILLEDNLELSTSGQVIVLQAFSFIN